MDWGVIGEYMLHPRILAGVWMTIQLTFVSLFFGFLIGLLVAVLRLSFSPVLRAIGAVFVWLFRAIPVLVLLVLVNNAALLYPTLDIGIPFGPVFWSADMRSFVPAFVVAIIALAVNEAANAAEIFRASILSIDRGQWEASTALGMARSRVYRRIILPQATKVAVPPLTNNAINMMKNTSLVAFIAIPDLLYTAQSIYAMNYKVFPLLMVVCFWYIVLVTALTVVQTYIERRFERSASRQVSARTGVLKRIGGRARA